MNYVSRQPSGFILPFVMGVAVLVSSAVVVAQVRIVKAQQVTMTLALQAEFWFWQQQLLRFYQRHQTWPEQLTDLVDATTALPVPLHAMTGRQLAGGYELQWQNIPDYAARAIAATHAAYRQQGDTMTLMTPAPQNVDTEAWLRTDDAFAQQRMETDLLANGFDLKAIKDFNAQVIQAAQLNSQDSYVRQAQISALTLGPMSLGSNAIQAEWTEIFSPVTLSGDIEMNAGQLVTERLVSQDLSALDTNVAQLQSVNATASSTRVNRLSAQRFNRSGLVQIDQLNADAMATDHTQAAAIDAQRLRTQRLNLKQIEATDYVSPDTSLLQNQAAADALYNALHACIYDSHFCLNLVRPRLEVSCPDCEADMNGDLAMAEITISIADCRFHCDVFWLFPTNLSTDCASRVSALRKSGVFTCTLKLRENTRETYSDMIRVTAVQRFDTSIGSAWYIPISWTNIATP